MYKAQGGHHSFSTIFFCLTWTKKSKEGLFGASECLNVLDKH